MRLVATVAVVTQRGAGRPCETARMRDARGPIRKRQRRSRCSAWWQAGLLCSSKVTPNQGCGGGEQNEYERSAVTAYFVGASGITSATRRSLGLTRTMALSPSLTKNECDFACGTLFAISGGIGCNSILSGTRSPIVSVALACALVNFKSFTFSLMMKRCSCVRLIVRGHLAPTRPALAE